MNGTSPYKSHWKQLVAQQAARKTPSPESTSDTASKPESPAPQAVRTLYQRYFQPYRYIWLAACLAVQAACLAVVFGRGEGHPGRQPVYGEVKLAGNPAARGSISFYPAEGHAGPAANTGIVNGRYHFSKQDGPFAGPHHVVLSYVWDAADEAQFALPSEKAKAAAATPKPPADGAEAETAPAGAPSPASKPRSHGQEFDVEVPAKGSLRIDFEIPD